MGYAEVSRDFMKIGNDDPNLDEAAMARLEGELKVVKQGCDGFPGDHKMEEVVKNFESLADIFKKIKADREERENAGNEKVAGIQDDLGALVDEANAPATTAPKSMVQRAANLVGFG